MHMIESAESTPAQPRSRVDAFNSWIIAGFNIGWDLGEGLSLFIPKGLLQPFAKVSPQALNTKSRSSQQSHRRYNAKTNQHGLLTPAVWLAHYVVSPLLGGVIALLALIPAILGGLVFNQEIRNLEYHYAMDVVNQYSGTAVWGALAMSVLLTYTWARDSFSLPAFALPSLSFYYFSTPGLAISPLLAAWLLPLTVAYGMMLLLSIGQSLNRMYDITSKFAVYQGEKHRWPYALRSVVDYELKNETLKQEVHVLFQSELEKMAVYHDKCHDQLRQILEREPTLLELSQKGVLTQYQLMREQKDLLTQLKVIPDKPTQQSIIQSRKMKFRQRIQEEI